MTDFLNDWGLTLVTFIPMAGAVLMMTIPQADEAAHKQVALVASVATAVMGALLMIDFDYGNAGSLQYQADESWIDVINSRYIMGLDGISLPLMALTLVVVPLCIIYSWDHIPPPGNAKAFLILILIPGDGNGRHVRRPGSHSLLRVLRDRVVADVLHNRRVGRAQSPLCVAQVLPLHFVRLGPDVVVVPGPVLLVEGPVHRRGAEHVRHARAQRCSRRRHRALHSAMDLRRHVHRLWREGADVPVPHMVA